MNLHQKCTAKPHSFLVIDVTLASDNPLRFRKNLLDRIQKLIMTIDDKAEDEKLQYDINRETARILTLSSYCKYKHIASEEILPSNGSQIIKQAKFTYSPLGEALEKQT